MKGVRIGNSTVPSNKRILAALPYIYGVGYSTSKQILQNANIDEKIRSNELTNEQISKIEQILSNYKVGAELKLDKDKQILLLKKLGIIKEKKNVKGRIIANKKKVVAKT